MTGAGTAVLSLAFSRLPDINPEQFSNGLEPNTKEVPQPRFEKPEGLPEDILTNKELAQNNIKIYQTAETQLYLRKSALEIPILKDAAEGKIPGVVISLVDHDRLSWSALDRLPPDARSVAQAMNYHPSEWSNDYWQELKRYFQESVVYHQGIIEDNKIELKKLLNGEEEKYLRSTVSLPVIQSDPEDLRYWQDRLEDLLSGVTEERIRKAIEDKLEDIAEAEDALARIDGPRDKAVEFFAEHGVGEPQGQLLHAERSFYTTDYPWSLTAKRTAYVAKHPEWLDKYYVYLCVKGNYEPNPDQSFPQPKDFYHFTSKNVSKKDPTPGDILRHELAHYEEHEEDEYKEEEEANLIAYQGIEKAWRRFKETGDNSDYAIIFVNKNGITYTKRASIDSIPG